MALIPPITRLSSSIIRILGCNPSPMTLQGTNTYLLGKGEKRILIDTGDANIPDYLTYLKEVLLSEKAIVDTIILTHWHHDHVGGVKDILNIYENCRVFKYPRLNHDDKMPEIPNTIRICELKDQQEFEVEGAKIKIFHTPGHTTDHVILASPTGIVFSGDCILGEGTAVFEDLHTYMESLHKILQLQPSVIYPGHGNVIENPIERITYYIKHRNERESQIIDIFTKNPTDNFEAIDIVKQMYVDTPKNLWPAATVNVIQHLNKLEKEGKLQKFCKANKSFYMLKS